jgi:hypothetical protein
MIETLILWQATRIRDDLDNDPYGDQDVIVWMLVLGSALWPVGVFLVARHHTGLNIFRSLLAAAALTSVTLFINPLIYVVVAIIFFVGAVCYFDREDIQ